MMRFGNGLRLLFSFSFQLVVNPLPSIIHANVNLKELSHLTFLFGSAAFPVRVVACIDGIGSISITCFLERDRDGNHTAVCSTCYLWRDHFNTGLLVYIALYSTTFADELLRQGYEASTRF